MTDLTIHFNNLALATFVAYRALCNLETPVACIIVHKETNEVFSFGCNDTNASLNGTRHAEFVAIDKILDQYDLLNAPHEKVLDFFGHLVLYVTVEPCVMCALAIQQIGLREVYFGAANDRFGGNGSVINVQDGFKTEAYLSFGGIMRIEAIYLLRCFYIQENETAPVPKIKKNKAIQGKMFPPNLAFNHFMTKSEFVRCYGIPRSAIFFHKPQEDLEITPVMERGYFFKDLINAEDVERIPDVKDLYPKGTVTIMEDLQQLGEMLPFVKNDGSVGWNYENEVPGIVV